MPKSKKTKKIEMTQEQAELFRELTKLSKRANQRLVRLEREFGKDTWASKRLRNKLESEPIQAWTRSGRVRVNKKMTITQLKATIKATNQFLNSKTSTKRGIKEVRKKQIETIQSRFDIDDKDFTYEDAEDFYDIFSDEYSWILSYMTPSEFQAMVEDAIENRDSENDWVKRLEDYITIGNDVDLRNKAIKLYRKFVEPYI